MDTRRSNSNNRIRLIDLLIMFSIHIHRGRKDKLWIRISKKVSKRAVDRNRLRRQVREIVRETTKLDLSPYIITVKKQALGQPYSLLKTELTKLLHELK